MPKPARPVPKLPWKAVLMPTEHGSWSFVLEPPLLGLAMGPSWRGFALVLAALLGFLAYRPIKLASRDVLARRLYPRTKLGLWSGGVLILLATLGLFASGAPWDLLSVQMLATSALLGIAFVWVDQKSRPGALGREMVGALITIPTAGAVQLCSGLAAGESALKIVLAISALCVLKSFGTILYVRARLRKIEADGAKTKETARSAGLARSTWLIAFAAGSLIGRWIQSPGFVPAAVFAALAFRCWYGLSGLGRIVAPKIVGLQEFGYSLLFVLGVGFSYWLRIA